ncbi:MAG: PDZ domain-containing protein, partial [Papillibacter sp.]|nr:PDZ domain-containing protein [Papillibacter sp.]
MIKSLNDRWSYYMTAEELENYTKETNNEYSGIGIVVQRSENGIVIVSVYSKSPAGEAGMLTGSIITSVGDNDLTQSSLEDALLLIGKAIEAGEVKLKVTQPDGSEMSFTLKPGLVETDPVSFELLPENVGLIKISNFEAKCAEQAKMAVDRLMAEGADGLIFDVRNNPGGQLDELLSLLDYLLPEGKIFIRRNIDGTVQEDMSDKNCIKIPMAVLVNEESYSAAEFFAAALKDYDWAVIAGARTTGKGYAQVTLKLTDGSAIHISAMEYYTPKGESLAGVGLTPDIEVKMEYEDWVKLYRGTLAHKDDKQLQAAIGALIEEIDKAA